MQLVPSYALCNLAPENPICTTDTHAVKRVKIALFNQTKPNQETWKGKVRINEMKRPSSPCQFTQSMEENASLELTFKGPYKVQKANIATPRVNDQDIKRKCLIQEASNGHISSSLCTLNVYVPGTPWLNQRRESNRFTTSPVLRLDSQPL